MIEIIYHPREYLVTVRGHAGSAEEGRDLVCAAVSALTETLECNLVLMEARGAVRFERREGGKGNAALRVTPRTRYRHIVRMVFDTICVGYDFLAGEYPEFIRYEMRG